MPPLYRSPMRKYWLTNRAQYRKLYVLALTKPADASAIVIPKR